MSAATGLPVEGALSLTVRPAAGEDGIPGVARLPAAAMAALRLGPGDIVSVTGGRRHFLRALAASEGAGAGTILLAAEARDNAEAGPGTQVRIAPATLPQAEAVALASSRPLPEARRPAIEAAAAERLLDRPVMEGDRLVLDPGTPAALVLEVASLTPPGAARITARTCIALGREAGPRRLPGVGGLDAPAARLFEMVELPLRRPDLFAHLGIAPPRGVLFTGPPGTGKTLLARAMAEASAARFFAVEGPEIVTKHYGESEARLRRLFAEAERAAPAIVFIDEIDAIAPRRDAVSGEKQLERRVVAQLLSLMDGLSARGRVVVMAATNMAHALDPALRRPGRFDREIPFAPPDEAARAEILDIHLGALPLDPEVDIAGLARRTHGYAGADLAALAREAGMAALARCGAATDPGPAPSEVTVTREDIAAALAATGPSALRETRIELPETRLEDVGGLARAKRALTEAVLWPLAHPELCRHYGVEPPSGVLLAGPPGGGKTLLARAIASESTMNFIPVRGAQLLTPYLGEAERRIADLFARARHAAPCLLFLDELDALAPLRGDADAAMARVVAQLLVEIDGIEALGRVVLIGATNRAGAIDPALLRPGRFDRVIEIAPPDADERAEILALKLRGHPLAPGIAPAALAARTPGWTGAALEGLVRSAARHALARHIAGGREAAEPIGWPDFDAAIADCAADRSPGTSKGEIDDDTT